MPCSVSHSTLDPAREHESLSGAFIYLIINSDYKETPQNSYIGELLCAIFRSVNAHIAPILESVRGPANAAGVPQGMVFAPRITAPGAVATREQASVVAGTSSFAFQASVPISSYLLPHPYFKCTPSKEPHMHAWANMHMSTIAQICRPEQPLICVHVCRAPMRMSFWKPAVSRQLPRFLTDWVSHGPVLPSGTALTRTPSCGALHQPARESSAGKRALVRRLRLQCGLNAMTAQMRV